MSVQTVLTQLKGYTDLVNLVSERIYRVRIPQNPTYPLIRFESNEGVENTLTGESSISNYRYDFECYGGDYSVVESIATELKNAMSAATTYKSICIEVSDDDYQDDGGNYSIFLGFSVWV